MGVRVNELRLANTRSVQSIGKYRKFRGEAKELFINKKREVNNFPFHPIEGSLQSLNRFYFRFYCFLI